MTKFTPTEIAMSEPITRADMAAIIEAVRNTGFPLIGWNGGPIPPSPFATMADAMAAALSASHQRVPGASARDELAGVESGPGRPIDIVERLNGDADGWESAVEVGDENGLAPLGAQYAAALEREAAAEITRLREQVGALEHEAANMANRRVELEDSERLAERRAGIEAAAQVAANAYSSCENSKNPTDRAEYNAARFIERAIRALADKPAPDQSKGG